jgi:hypothetical protein
LLVLACLSASLCVLTLAFTLPYTGVDLSTVGYNIILYDSASACMLYVV